MFTILPAHEDHIPAIISIAEKTWWPTYSPILNEDQIRYMLQVIYNQEALLKLMREGTQKFIVLRDANGFQGFAAYGVRPEDTLVFKLHKLYVLPENHGRGFGLALINEVISTIEKTSATALDLNVNRYNPAKTFYEKIGFHIIREEDVPIGPYFMNDFVMRLELRNKSKNNGNT
jgi:diamine N-acetyltransferase